MSAQIALVISLSSMGLPGLNGFIGEFTILLGSLGSTDLGFFFTLFATLGVIMAAVYILYMFQRVFMGEFKAPPHGDESSLKLTWNEIAALIPILILIFWIGLQPVVFFNSMDATSNQLVELVEDARDQMELETADSSAESEAAVAQDAASAEDNDNPEADSENDGETSD